MNFFINQGKRVCFSTHRVTDLVRKTVGNGNMLNARVPRPQRNFTFSPNETKEKALIY